MSHPTRQSVLFEGLFSKPVTVAFDTDLQSSDGGAPLLAGLDRTLGLTDRLAGCLRDDRQACKVRHELRDLLRQAIFSRALGYADGNDASLLASDPALQTACDRVPGSEDAALASQPTLSRFEHAPSARELRDLQMALEDLALERMGQRCRRPRLVTLDLDSTHDPAYGQQQMVFFHGYYDCHCYRPLLGFLSADGEPEQWLVHARLRSGKARDSQGVIPLLRRLVPKIKRRFRKARVRVRLDAGFATPRILAVLDELKVQYLVAFGTNSKLEEEVEHYWSTLESLAEDGSVRHYDDFFYKARSWKSSRRVIAKVEVLQHEGRPLRRNPRFVVAKVPHGAEKAYAIYCGRGDSENRIKELKRDLELDRTSCTSFRANAFRVLLTAAAYMLFQELRWKLRGTRLARAQVASLRAALLKISVRLVVSVRRIVMHGPAACPAADLWRKVARSVGAVPV